MLKFLWYGKLFFEKLAGKNYIPWFNFLGKIIKVPNFLDRYLPQGDIIVATSWDTAKWVARASSSKGKKFYFIQQYEVWGGKDEVDESFKLPLRKIVIASWLQKLLKEKFHENSYLLVNGVDTKLFHPVKVKRNKGEFRIGMLYHPAPWKGTKYGFAAYRIAKKEIPELKLVLISAYPMGDNFPPDTEFHFMIPPARLKYIYSSCDLWISPSLSEGCQAPPMEAMACGVPVIATRVGGIPDYTIPGKTAIVVEPRDVKTMAESIKLLYNDSILRHQVAKAGYNYITKKFTIDGIISKLEDIFLESLDN